MKLEGKTDEQGNARFIFCVEGWTWATPGDVVISVVAIFEDETWDRTVTVKVVGPPAFITITAAPNKLICGECATIAVTVKDAIQQNVPDGTVVELFTNHGGVLVPPAPRTFDGVAIAYALTSEVHSGTYVIIAKTVDTNFLTGITTQVSIGAIREGPFIRSQTEDAISEVIASRPGIAVDKSGKTRTILFTDIESSSAMAFRLGDEAWASIRREHDALLETNVVQHGGIVVKKMGDGFYCVFDEAADGVEAAKDIQRALDDYRTTHRGDPRAEVHVRMGLHTGEVGQEENDFFGASVVLAQRVSALARGSQILASDVTRGILVGRPDLIFVEGEAVQPKGWSEVLRVFQLMWQHQGRQ